MPVCKGCGGSYDDKFKFCPYCGRSTPEPESLKVEIKVSSSDRFEICQIENYLWDGVEYSSGKFYAEAIGMNGEYVAGESPNYWVHHRTSVGGLGGLVNGYSGAGIAHSFLINQLSEDGWEAVTLSGGKWWQTRFQRRVGEDYPKPWSLWLITVKQSRLGYYFELSNTKMRGKKWETIIHAKSHEYKQQQNISLFTANKKMKLEEINKENLRNLEEFLEEIISDEFKPIEHAMNEQLKKCITEKLGYLGYDHLWHYRVFLKREQS